VRQIYLNNATDAYPLISGVVETMASYMQNPTSFSGRDGSGNPDCLFRCRSNVAELLEVHPEQIVFLSGATHGLNAAILGVSLKPGDLVITSVTEHNSVLRPLARLQDLLGVRIAYVPLTDDMRLDDKLFNDFLNQKPRLVVLNHAGNVTGRINPVRPWFEKAKSAGATTLLDASQTVGRIPVRPRELSADLVVFPGHKGLRGPLGTGVLWVAPEVSLAPAFVGGTGYKSELREQPEEMPARLEAGTPNTPAFVGLEQSVLYIRNNFADIIAAERSLTQMLYRGLSEIENVQIFDGENLAEDERIPILSFRIAGMELDQAGFALTESFGIHCRTGLHCAPLIHSYLGSLPDGTVRFSPSFATPKEDIDYAIDAVRRLAA